MAKSLACLRNRETNEAKLSGHGVIRESNLK